MPTVYSTSLAHDEIVAAQMCLDTTSISLEEPHVIDIISDLDSFSINTSNCVKITTSDFEKMFYGKNVSSLAAAVPFDQSFSLIGTGQTAVNYYQLDASANNDINAPDDTQYSIMNGNGEPTNQTVSLVKPVTDFWVKDTGHSVDCWSTCSYMSIQKEIEATHNLQNLDCNICCSLCYGELLGLLDSKYPLDDGTKRTRVVTGDKVGIRILYKNAFEGTKNVEVRIHYQIEPEPELEPEDIKKLITSGESMTIILKRTTTNNILKAVGVVKTANSLLNSDETLGLFKNAGVSDNDLIEAGGIKTAEGGMDLKEFDLVTLFKNPEILISQVLDVMVPLATKAESSLKLESPTRSRQSIILPSESIDELVKVHTNLSPKQNKDLVDVLDKYSIPSSLSISELLNFATLFMYLY